MTRLIALGADVAAHSAALSSKLRDPSVSSSSRGAIRGTPAVGGGRRAWRDLPGVTPPQIRERR